MHNYQIFLQIPLKDAKHKEPSGFSTFYTINQTKTSAATTQNLKRVTIFQSKSAIVYTDHGKFMDLFHPSSKHSPSANINEILHILNCLLVGQI